MPKYAIDDIMDAGLNHISTTAIGLVVCTNDVLTGGDPDYTKVTSTSALTGIVVLDAGDFAALTDGITGRRLTVNAQNDILITTSGDAAHICLVDTSGLEVIYMTTCTTQTLTSSNNVSVPAWDIELRDPA